MALDYGQIEAAQHQILWNFHNIENSWYWALMMIKILKAFRYAEKDI